MGSTAPSMESARHTLQRLVANKDDDLWFNAQHERKRLFSHEEDMFVGLLICQGDSQQSAMFLINGERIANGLDPVIRGPRSCAAPCVS